MQADAGLAQQVAELESRIVRAEQSGREDEARQLMERLLEVDPKHGGALRWLGQRAFRAGDLARAREYFQRHVDADGSDPQHWASLALACRGLKDEAGEAEAIRQALIRQPRDLLALVMRANLLERQGRGHEAARAYGSVLDVAPPAERLHPDLRSSVAYAARHREHYDRTCGAFLDDFLAPHLREHAGADLRRFRDSVDIMVGRKRRYESIPSHYFYPRLAPFEYFDREEFAWMPTVEAATDAIRREFLEVVRSEEGFSPYIQYDEDQPLDQWRELNRSPRWNVFHLILKGERVEENAARCPETMRVLAEIGQPEQPGRTPNAMFSVLKPHTRIPPHTGVSNARLVAHLPLVIPEKCGFRVGNDTREWVPGKAWVFDDTIEHEAWNDSDQPRTVFIFDVWHPHLTPAERSLISALARALNAFTGEARDEEPGL